MKKPKPAIKRGLDREDVQKLSRLEDELIHLIWTTDSEPLMEKFIEWQNQRSKCNDAFYNLMSSIPNPSSDERDKP